MAKIQIVGVENLIDGSIVEHVIIDNGDDSFTSMLKSTWDELESQKELGGTL